MIGVSSLLKCAICLFVIGSANVSPRVSENALSVWTLTLPGSATRALASACSKLAAETALSCDRTEIQSYAVQIHKSGQYYFVSFLENKLAETTPPAGFYYKVNTKTFAAKRYYPQ